MNFGEAFFVILGILAVQSMCLTIYIIHNKTNTKTDFGRFCAIFFIGMTASLIPMGPLSAIFGFPAVLITSIFATLIFKEKKSE